MKNLPEDILRQESSAVPTDLKPVTDTISPKSQEGKTQAFRKTPTLSPQNI